MFVYHINKSVQLYQKEDRLLAKRKMIHKKAPRRWIEHLTLWSSVIRSPNWAILATNLFLISSYLRAFICSCLSCFTFTGFLLSVFSKNWTYKDLRVSTVYVVSNKHNYSSLTATWGYFLRRSSQVFLSFTISLIVTATSSIGIRTCFIESRSRRVTVL